MYSQKAYGFLKYDISDESLGRLRQLTLNGPRRVQGLKLSWQQVDSNNVSIDEGYNTVYAF